MAATLSGACALKTNKIMRKSLGENDTWKKLYVIDRNRERKAKTKMRRCECERAILISFLRLRIFALRHSVFSLLVCLRNFAFSPLHLCIFVHKVKM